MPHQIMYHLCLDFLLNAQRESTFQSLFLMFLPSMFKIILYPCSLLPIVFLEWEAVMLLNKCFVFPQLSTRKFCINTCFKTAPTKAIDEHNKIVISCSIPLFFSLKYQNNFDRMTASSHMFN